MNQARVALDTSAIRRFADAGVYHVVRLMGYLGNRAIIVDYVEKEVAAQAGSHRDLGRFRRQSPYWPRVATVPPEMFPEILRIQRALRDPGDPETKHLGEIATVVWADHQKVPLCIMDDRDGRRLAKTRGVETLSTAMLVVEMVANGAMTADEGFAVFDRATPDRVGRSDFDANVAEFIQPNAG